MARASEVRWITVAILLAVTSCGVLLPETPQVGLALTGGWLELDGDASMQSVGAGGAQNNDPVDLDHGLALGDRDFAVGGALTFGDGFMGPELWYTHYQTYDTQPGSMTADFGALQAGDSVSSKLQLEQLRLQWLAQLFETTPFETQAPVTFRFGAGLGLHHHVADFESTTLGVTPSRRQDLDIKDTGVPMLLGRFETERLPFKLRLDAGWMEGDFGDLDGRFLDLSVTAHYRIQKGIWGWIGYWRYDLPFQRRRALRAVTRCGGPAVRPALAAVLLVRRRG
jgi:hypothetical protein